MFVETSLRPYDSGDRRMETTLVNLDTIELAERDGRETIITISGKKYRTSLNYDRVKSFVSLYLAKD